MEPPKQEDELFDRWVYQYSKSVKTNMCTYFEWFKILKLNDETKKYCQTLPGEQISQNTGSSFRYFVGLLWDRDKLIPITG